MRTLTITTAEWASVQDGTLWLVREGVPCATPHSCPKFTRQMCRWGGIHPPAEFVQACAPCETCGNSRWVDDFDVEPAHGGDSPMRRCPDCRIELVGPCPTCNGAGGEENPAGGHLVEYLGCPDCRCNGIVTLGHAHAVGQPLPIDIPLSHPHDRLPDDHICYDRMFRSLTHVRGGIEVADLTDRLTHYGPPESLVGKWAVELAVTA